MKILIMVVGALQSLPEKLDLLSKEKGGSPSKISIIQSLG
jgi:hypothetical protein